MSFPPPNHGYPVNQNFINHQFIPPPQLGYPINYRPMMPAMPMPPMNQTILPHMMPRLPVQEAQPVMIPIINPNTPKSTIFVGNISKYTTDSMVREILSVFGMNSWNLVSVATDNNKGFGFCEYHEPKSSFRALKLLNGYKIADKKLLVKIDQNTQDTIDDFKKKEEKSGNNYLSYEQTDEAVLQRVKHIIHKYKPQIEAKIKAAGLDPKQTFKNADAVDDTKIDGDNRETDLERKRLKRRLKQKEKSYLERLHRWELREERKSREYNRDMEKSIFKKKEVLRKKKKMERMLESYDDIKDDPYNYEGISYEAKLRAMKIEEEEDRQDRLREQDEIEQEKELKLKKKLEAVEVEPIVEPIDIKPVPEPVDEIEIKPEPEPENESNTDQVLDIEKYANQPINIATVTKPKIENSVLFEEEEEENALHKKKMPKLEEIEYEPNEKVIGTGNMYHIESNTNRVDYHNAGPDEKKRIVLKFVERIPSDKDKLFGYYIDWHYVTDGHVLSKIKPWINKKLTELLGDEEPVLENFIAQKLKDQTTPVSIVRDLFPILDDDAEIFVIKMWRLLIYEIFAEQNGIVKN